MMESPKAKETILDAAERLFSERGYEGTSMRSIAEEANVAQGLIHYHWKTKEQLFESIIARGSRSINTEREKLLENCLRYAEKGIPSLEQVLETFVRPAIEQGRSKPGKYFSQIIAMFANSDDMRSRELIHKYYDPIARKYISALQKVLPGLSLSEVYWGYLLATSVVVSSMARTGRIKRLSEGAFDDNDTELIIHRLIRFIANGLKGLSELSVPVTVLDRC
jgi:AcrR family transcriptional regulator